MTTSMLRRAQAAMKCRDTSVEDLCRELGISSPTLYRYVDAKGILRPAGEKLLKTKKK